MVQYFSCSKGGLPHRRWFWIFHWLSYSCSFSAKFLSHSHLILLQDPGGSTEIKLSYPVIFWFAPFFETYCTWGIFVSSQGPFVLWLCNGRVYLHRNRDQFQCCRGSCSMLQTHGMTYQCHQWVGQYQIQDLMSHLEDTNNLENLLIPCFKHKHITVKAISPKFLISLQKQNWIFQL